jgi:RNA polymerase sigma factor (sigma-70 family)
VLNLCKSNHFGISIDEHQHKRKKYIFTLKKKYNIEYTFTFCPFKNINRRIMKVNNLRELSDAALALLAADKNNFDALLEIERRYEKKVYWHVMKAVHDVPYAEEITHRTFDAAKDNFENGTYKDKGKLVNWLYRIARKIHEDDVRKAARHPIVELTEEVLDEIIIADDAERALEEEKQNIKRLQLIGKALHECSQRERLSFILYFIKSNPDEESSARWERIGLRLGIKGDSARKEAYRCRQHVWKILGKNACEDMILPYALGKL